MNALRGVNLGGWLVLERWMTPGLFSGTDAIDEYTFMQTEGAREKLRKHHREFIQEEDFIWMAKNGVNAVRLPIGYWILDGDSPFVSSIGRLDWAVRMCKKYEIKLLVCLHGAPGSQNGRDHSGKAGPVDWWNGDENMNRTVDILSRLADRYRGDESVWGIELMNEPYPRFFQPKLRKFYKVAYDRIAKVSRPGIVVVFSDGFTPRLMSGAIWQKFANTPVCMDHHWYHFFIPGWLQSKLSFKLYYSYMRLKSHTLMRLAKAQPIIIGEWSGIIGGEKLNRYPAAMHEKIIDEHIRQQLKTYKDLAGWFYWSYKTEDRGVFHFRSMVEDGRIGID